MKEIVKYRRRNCYIPNSGLCFTKCVNGSLKITLKKIFTRSEEYWSGVMTSPRIQPFCWKHNVNFGCFDRKRMSPRNLTQRNTSLFIQNNHFSLTWKSNGINFNQVIEDEIKPNIEFVDKCISDKHGKRFIKYEHKPKKFNLQQLILSCLNQNFLILSNGFPVLILYINYAKFYVKKIDIY